MSQPKIQDVDVTLWGKYRVTFKPYPDVNIIVGINGSGKTTLLNLLEQNYLNTKDSNARYVFIPSIDNLKVKDGRKKANALTQTLESLIYYNQDGASLMYYRMSMLDAPSEQQTKVTERIVKFCNIVNTLFHETGKKIKIEGNNFLIYTNESQLDINDLSSGEKQVLLLLLRVFLLGDKGAVVFIDEPESSLDISWQYKLIDLLVNLNPNAQFFITTHSPSIFGDGWGDKIIYMEDVTVKTEK